MQTRYVAYGLELRSSFPLPGMTPVAAEELPSVAPRLPSLTLRRRTPEELTSAWSGSNGPPAWRGRLGDGRDLTVERGKAGDLLFTYGDRCGERARFRLHASREVLDCAARDDRPDWQRALIGKVLCNVSVMRGYEALHAAAVDSPEGVVAFAGPSGAGKSTLATELMRRGWPLFADDALVLKREASGVRAHPATPHMTLAEDPPDAIESLELGTILANLAGEQWIAADLLRQEPRPVRMLCLLERAPGLALHAQVLPANPLLLAPYMLGFQGDRERQRRRFHLYADLIGSTTLVGLTGEIEDRPCDLADLLERVLAHPPALVGSAA